MTQRGGSAGSLTTRTPPEDHGDRTGEDALTQVVGHSRVVDPVLGRLDPGDRPSHSHEQDARAASVEARKDRARRRVPAS